MYKKGLSLIACLTIYSLIYCQSDIKVDFDKQSPALRMPWKNCIGVGRAYDLTRTDLLEHLKYVQENIGYRYCRFHAIFDDDMGVVTRSADGVISYNWHQIDNVYDALLKIGLRPFVELNPMPTALASGTTTMFKYKMNVTPPKSFDEWSNLVYAFTNHLVERYGLEEVRKWYFEVWNEPNLLGFWTGSKEEYWKLYAASAFAVKKVDKELRIGGPATSKANWVADIIDYCKTNQVPLDFISTHLYPQDEMVTYPEGNSPHKPGDFFQDIFRDVQKIVCTSSMPNLEIHWTEWNTLAAKNSKDISWTKNVNVDNVSAASLITYNCMALDTVCNTMSYWVASDIFAESGIPNSLFSCTYGLITIHGIPKASYNAFYFLNKMKGKVLNTTIPAGNPPDYGVVVTNEVKTMHVLMWNYQPLGVVNQKTWSGNLQLPSVFDNIPQCVEATIRPGSGSAWETWQDMGSPLNITKTQEQLLRAAAMPDYKAYTLKKQGEALTLSFNLKPGDVKYFEITNTSLGIKSKGVSKDDIIKWEKIMGDKSLQ